MADKIQNAYETSKNIYDDVLTQRNIFSKLYIKLFWSGTDDNDIARKVLSYVPDDFSGNLLDCSGWNCCIYGKQMELSEKCTYYLY